MKYTHSHEWIRIDKGIATVGITDHAQKELGEIVYVELPVVGHSLKAGDEVIVLESTKAAIDIYTPLSGEISEVNLLLQELPEKINLSAQNEGWLFKIKLSDPKELDSLLDENEYLQNTAS